MSQSEITLDRIDLKILQVLQENGRLSNVELSASAWLCRLRRACAA